MNRNVLFFLLFIPSCIVDPKVDNRSLNVINNYSERVYVFQSQNDSLNLPFNDCDSASIDTFLYHYYSKKVGDTINLSIKNTWEQYISECKNQKFRLFIIEQKLVDKYGWEYISKRNIYSKKKLLDVKKMEDMNWTLKYDNATR